MSSDISNKALVDRCQGFIVKDPNDKALRALIKDALISADREIARIGSEPLAWLRERYNELFTRAYASISAITQAADPCVVTAASSDSDVTGHGFQSDDIVFCNGVNGMDELNRRVFRVNRIDATTLGLYQLNDQIAIDSSGYDTYTSGGKIYHCGIKIPHATIEPTGGTAAYEWVIKRVFAATFDSYPATPMAEEVSTIDARYLASIGRPDKWRYQRYSYARTPEHYLMFNRPADKRYNIDIHIEKSYPDLGTWTASVYPPSPNEIHDCIWHRALANLATNAEKQRRETKERVAPHIEVLYAQHWKQKAMEDEKFIRSFSRNLLGAQPAQGLGVRFNNPGLCGRGSGARAARP